MIRGRFPCPVVSNRSIPLTFHLLWPSRRGTMFRGGKNCRSPGLEESRKYSMDPDSYDSDGRGTGLEEDCFRWSLAGARSAGETSLRKERTWTFFWPLHPRTRRNHRAPGTRDRGHLPPVPGPQTPGTRGKGALLPTGGRRTPLPPRRAGPLMPCSAHAFRTIQLRRRRPHSKNDLYPGWEQVGLHRVLRRLRSKEPRETLPACQADRGPRENRGRVSWARRLPEV